MRARDERRAGSIRIPRPLCGRARERARHRAPLAGAERLQDRLADAAARRRSRRGQAGDALRARDEQRVHVPLRARRAARRRESGDGRAPRGACNP